MRRIQMTLSIAMLAAAGLAGQQPTIDQIRDQARLARDMAREQVRIAMEQAKRVRPFGNEAEYRNGQRALDAREYDKAVSSFDRVITAKSERADGAMYWKAFALNKLGRRDQALAALADLEKQFSQSRWLSDARALAAEVRAAGGQAASPESQNDEELKLLAINSLINQDPDRAIPLLEKLLNDAKTAPSLKRRALFVLTQSKAPKAREIVTQYAKGGSNPDLQLQAIEYLGTFRSPDSTQALGEVYAASSDPGVKRAVLRGFVSSKSKDRLLQVARTEQNVELRRAAVQYLASMQAGPELVELARKETDPALRREMVLQLSRMQSKEATDYLTEILSK